MDGEGEGEGDADDDVCDGEAVGFSVVVTDEGPGLGAPAGIVTDGVGGLAEGAALCAGDGAALARPGMARPGMARPGMAPDETPATPAPRPRAEAWGRCAPPAVVRSGIKLRQNDIIRYQNEITG